MVAALEIVTGNLDLLHTPEEEIKLIEIAAEMNLYRRWLWWRRSTTWTVSR